MSGAKKVPVTDYAFAIGRVRALERHLIPSSLFEEAIEAGLKECLRLFAETAYSDDILHVTNSGQLEEILEEEVRNLKKTVTELILEEELLGLLKSDSIDCAANILRRYPSEFLQGYLRHLIDMHNIKTFLRCYLVKEPREVLEKNLTCEGFIRIKDLLKLYDRDIAALLNYLEYVHNHCQTIDYAAYLGEAIKKAENERSFIALEKEINNFLIEALKPAKYICFGPEPIIAFYFAKLNEINLMRMVIMGKLNNLTQDMMKERMNLVYA